MKAEKEIFKSQCRFHVFDKENIISICKKYPVVFFFSKCPNIYTLNFQNQRIFKFDTI